MGLKIKQNPQVINWSEKQVNYYSETFVSFDKICYKCSKLCAFVCYLNEDLKYKICKNAFQNPIC